MSGRTHPSGPECFEILVHVLRFHADGRDQKLYKVLDLRECVFTGLGDTFDYPLLRDHTLEKKRKHEIVLNTCWRTADPEAVSLARELLDDPLCVQ